MKPIKLTIQAFGPFVGKEEIDFSSLGNSPLFLINGPTGSGKSTILDAICFALYGKTTGADREASQMRCDQADAKLLTEVTLDFDLGDKHYRIKRSPAQERAKARGEGLTEHNGEAHLWEIDAVGDTNLIVTKKVREATEEIERITGLNVEQFRQVMVLPQGKFRELLLADSADREKIFSKLFQTNIYKRIEEALKTKAIAIYNDKIAYDKQIKVILDFADLNTEEEVENNLETQVPELKAAKKHKEEMHTSLQVVLGQKESAEALLKQYADFEDTKIKLAEIEEKKIEIDNYKKILANAQNALKITPIFDNLVRLSNEKEELENKLKVSDAQGDQLKIGLKKSVDTLEKAKRAAQESDELKKKVTELNDSGQK